MVINQILNCVECSVFVDVERETIVFFLLEDVVMSHEVPNAMDTIAHRYNNAF